MPWYSVQLKGSHCLLAGVESVQHPLIMPVHHAKTVLELLVTAYEVQFSTFQTQKDFFKISSKN